MTMTGEVTKQTMCQMAGEKSEVRKCRMSLRQDRTAFENMLNSCSRKESEASVLPKKHLQSNVTAYTPQLFVNNFQKCNSEAGAEIEQLKKPT